VLKDERISLNNSMIANFIEIYYGKVRIVKDFEGGVERFLKSREDFFGFLRVFHGNLNFFLHRFALSSL
jgi:hypothetical protein